MGASNEDRADSVARPPRPVTVSMSWPEARPAVVSAVGEVTPEWETILKAQVGGAVLSLAEGFRNGARVKAGEVLVTLEQSALQAEVAEAESRLARAEVALLTEEREGAEADRSWRRSGMEGDPPSPLVMRRPQRKAALKERNAARSELARARYRLACTTIRAPYDGIVRERHVDPGQVLFDGTDVATLFSTGNAKVAVHLDAHQWDLLPRELEGAPATLRDPLQRGEWKAVITRCGRHLERDSRLRTLYLGVADPFSCDPPLLPGTFVTVEIQGAPLDGLLRIPESAYTRKGEVWYLDETDRLRSFAARPLFLHDGQAYIATPPFGADGLRIVLYPTLETLAGTRVHPVAVGPEV